MQDRYAGDVGDYGKFALLQAMEAQGLKLGISWYRTETAAYEIHHDGNYGIPSEFAECDSKLSAALNAIFYDTDSRSVQKLEEAGLLKCSSFIHDLVPREIQARSDWHQHALAYFSDCDLVFLDPDNGLEVKSVKAGTQKSVKYVCMNEIAEYVAAGKSVIFYNHRPRKKAEVYFAEYAARFASHPVLCGKQFSVITFPRRSIRDYFIIPASPSHEVKICAALRTLEDGPFGETGFCFIQPS